MRTIGRLVAALFLLALCTWAGLAAWPRIALHLASNPAGAGNEEARSTRVYLLPAGKEIEFVLARQPSRVRIAGIGITAAGAEVPPEATWRLRWQLLDGRGALLGEGTYDGNCRPPATWTDGDGRVQPARWLPDARQKPCADNLLFLRLTAEENAARVRLRLEPGDSRFTGVGVRVMQRVQRTRGRDSDIAWQRMNDETRAELARFHPYPPFLLTPGEISALTANEWRPVGPQGIAGEDFGATTLFYLPADAQDPATSVTTNSLVADAAHHVTIPVFAAGEAALRLVPLVAATAPVAAELVVHPVLPWASATLPLTIPPEGLLVSRHFARGLVEVITPVPVAVDIVDADEATVAHEGHRLRTLRLDDGDTVDWSVSHARGATTALRLDVRGYVDPTGRATRETDALTWQWLDRAGKVLRSGVLAPSITPSVYDQPADGGIVSDPASAWFRLPPEVATLRVIARGALLANAWSRVDGMPLPRSVPSQQRAWFDDPRRIPEWFRLDPANLAASAAADHSTLLHIQHRPLPPTRIGEDTLVDVMAPEQARALAARIVLPVSGVPFKLPPAASHLYAPIDASCGVTLVAARGEQRVQPQLLFTGGRDLAPVHAVIDGQPLELPAPAGAAGVIDLPPLGAGTHRLCVVDRSGRRWYASHAQPGNDRLIEGGGYWLDARDELTFIVEKGDAPVTLNMRYYGSDRSAAPPVLQATVAGVPAHGVFGGYTMQRTTWTLPATGGASLPGVVLQRGGARVGAPQTVNLVLDSDLPAGRWRVHVALAGGNPGYLAVSRLAHASEGATRAIYEVP